MLLSERRQPEKATYHIILWLYDILEKEKLWNLQKDQWLVGRGSAKQAEHGGFLGKWNYSVWYCDHGYMSLFFQTCKMYNAKSDAECKLWIRGDYDVLM